MNKSQRQARIEAARLEYLPKVKQQLTKQIDLLFEYIKANPHWRDYLDLDSDRIIIETEDIFMFLPTSKENIEQVAKRIVFNEIKYLKDIKNIELPSKNSVDILKYYDKLAKKEQDERNSRQALRSEKLRMKWSLEEQIKQLEQEIKSLDY